MKNNKQVRIREEAVSMRKFTVDDAALFSLEKIYFSQVRKICAPVLKNAGYSVGKIEFHNMNVFANGPFFRELSFYEGIDAVLPLFVFKVRSGGNKFLAVYALYSSRIYLLKDSGAKKEVIDYGELTPGESVYLNIRYAFQNNGLSLYRDIYLYSRKALIEKTFLLKRPFLHLIGDCSMRKFVSCKYDDEVEAFAHGFDFFVSFQKANLFSLTGKK